MTYELMPKELIAELKAAGFPEMEGWIEGAAPSLSELIEACGEQFSELQHNGQFWTARHRSNSEFYASALSSGNQATPEIAVARLWLALNKK